MEDSKVVAELRTRLAESIGQERYKMWFGELAELRLGEDSLTITAETSFTRDWLRRNFADDVRTVVAAVMGGGVRVEFDVDESRRSPTDGSPTDGGGQRANAESRPATSSPNRAVQIPASSISKPHVRVANPAPPAQLSHFIAGHSNGAASRTQPVIATRTEPKLAELVVGTSNEYAYRAAEVTAHGLQQASPVTFCGGTGVGKTHLLRAIRAEYRLTHPRRCAVYLSAEQFITGFVEALRGSGLPSFRQKCRGADVLLIDDIQFFVGKRASLEELLHTVDVLLAEGRQLVLASDRMLGELQPLGKELVSRLASGLVCNLQSPDFAMRLEIVRRLGREMQLTLEADVVELVATQISGGARELRGALHRLQATSVAFRQPVTREMALSALCDLAQQSTRHVRLSDVEQAVCDVFGVESTQLRSDRKSRSIHEPRMLAMWLARKYTRAPWSEIGEFFGRRSHSTVISAHQRVEKLIRSRAEIGLSHETCGVEEAIRRVEAALRTA